MTFAFTKMHGLGNDYVFVNLLEADFEADWPAVARRVSERHRGIGSDGLILICRSELAEIKMRILNADGSEAEMCGNGLRCVAKYAFERGLLQGQCDLPANLAAGVRRLTGGVDDWQAGRIETGAGVLTVTVHKAADGKVDVVCVDMGQPRFHPDSIAVKVAGERVVGYQLDVAETRVSMTCVSMGNPHAVIFTETLDEVDVDELGPKIENCELFSERTNVHFAEVSGQDCVRIITWERGSGRTLACGTGACAVCVAGALEGRLGRDAIAADLPGGRLTVLWSDDDDHVYMLGPAVEVFQGSWLGG